jgi:hypothetical protein
MVRGYFAGLALALLCAACVEKYADVDATTPSASMTFKKAYDTANIDWGGGIQGFDFSDEGHCSTMKRAAVLTAFSDDSETRSVVAGRRVTVLAFSTLFRKGVVRCPQGICTEIVMCQSGLSFVPEQNHRYIVTQSAGIDSTVCPIHVIDDATGSAPVSAQRNFHEYCPEARLVPKSGARIQTAELHSIR